jgi:hypothetical protein
MRIVRPAVVAVLVAGLAACHPAPPRTLPVPSPGEAAAIRGTVMDYESSQPLQNTGVEILYPGDINHPLAGGPTYEKGQFAFDGLPAGVYVVRVVRPGYNEVRIRVELKSAEQRPLDVRLRSLRERCIATRYHTDICP